MDGMRSADACFFPRRAMSPQVRPPAGPPDVGRSTRSLSCSCRCYHEIMRVASLLKHQHGGDFQRLQPMASPNQMHHHLPPPMPNFCGNGFGPWNHGAHPECLHGRTPSPSKSCLSKRTVMYQAPTSPPGRGGSGTYGGRAPARLISGSCQRGGRAPIRQEGTNATRCEPSASQTGFCPRMQILKC